MINDLFDTCPGNEPELRALQLERLRWSLRHAYDNVEHYRRTFQAANITPGDLHSLEDLARFPFLTKQEFRATYPFGLFAVPREQVLRIHASSGTTGKPTVVGYTARDIDAWATLVARSIYVAGGRPGDMVHIAYGYGLFTGGLGAHYGAERLGCTVIPMSGGQTQKQVQLIEDFRPRVIMATPSYLLSIADEFVNQGKDPRNSSLRIAICGAEPWTEAMRSTLEARFGLDALDIYGLSEVMGPGVACEALDSKGGATLWEDHFFPEIIDPDTGAVLPEGSQGELVLTSLAKEALPVIRYRTRDLTRLLPPASPLPLRRMARISARTDDMLIIRGVNVFPTQIEELVLATEGCAAHFQIVVARAGNLDEVEVKVECNSAIANDRSSRDSAARALADRVKAYVGISVSVTVMDPGSIERSTGKASRVFDRRAALR